MKYTNLLYEIHRLYSVEMVGLIIGVLGGIRNTLFYEMKKLPPCHNSDIPFIIKIQRAVTLGSLYLLRQLNWLMVTNEADVRSDHQN